MFKQRSTWVLIPVMASMIGIAYLDSFGQAPKRKPTRAKAPQFDSKTADGIYFADVKKQLQGDLPKAGTLAANNPVKAGAVSGSSPGNATEAANSKPWNNSISSSSIEDLIKGAKLRLDTIVVSQAKFIGGGFKDARREFTLLASLFGIIEQYPNQVRWKDSATLARMHMVRVAASSKVGSPEAFKEAKKRVQELADLVSGGSIKENEPIEELNWGDAIDRVPIMLILEWGLREHLVKHCANPKEFEENSEEVLKFAELIATLGEVLLQKGMTDQGDPEYVKFSKAMIEQAQATVQGVKLNSQENAREATALINQACDNCHNTYR